MISPFSIRHRKLIEQNKLNLNLTENQKYKFLYLFEAYDESWSESTSTGWNYTTSAGEEAYKDLLRIYGVPSLKSFKNEQYIEVSTINDFLLGTKSECVLDVIEVFYARIFPENKLAFIRELNQLLKAEQLSIRFLESEFVRLDSEFAESEILFKTSRLLKEESFDKSHFDFLDARQRLSSGDFSGCIFSANNALESFLKKLLNSKNDNQGSLKKLLIKSNLIPNYFDGFLENFEGLLQAAFTIANKSSRHGQRDIPEEINKVDEPIANFYLNLVGSLIIFVSERHIFLKPQSEKNNNISSQIDTDAFDDLPF